jgi:hypothetical protein
LALVARPAAGQGPAGEAWPLPAGADVALVGPEAAVGPVREVLEELLSREGVEVSWTHLDRLRAEDVLEPTRRTASAPVHVWIDLTSTMEARLYFRAPDQRFVIRRVTLPGGSGPLVTEEIAQIVQSVLRALASGTAWALSLPEARVAMREPPPSSSPAARPAPPSREAVVEVGSGALGELYAPGLPVAGSVVVSVAGLVRPAARAEAPAAGALGAALVFGYGLPSRFASGAVGAELETTSLRFKLLWEPWRGGRLSLRLGAGGGADRVIYAPRAELPAATPAPAGTFYTWLGSLGADLRIDVSGRVAVAAGATAEVSFERVHYDAYDATGTLTEVLVPYRLRPGLSLGVEVRL